MATKKLVKKAAKVVKKAAKAVKEATSIKCSGEVILLLKQHVGKPCVPVVKKGDKVQVGELIAKPQGLGANIHSSVAGTVTKVDENGITIKPQGQLSLLGQALPKKIKTSKADLLGCVNEAGCVGMGGAGFPTGAKLSTDLKGGYILVNAAECEPFLGHNMEQIRRYPKETIKGIQYCMKIANAKHGIIAIKRKHEKEIQILLDNLKGISDIHVHLMPDIYPMGEERAVVRECLGILLGVNDLPSKANAHVCNVESVLRVYEAIEYGRPVVSKHLTVIGNLKGGKAAKVFMDVPVGLKVKDVIAMAGGINGDYGEIIMGGSFTGRATTLDAPITKTTGAIIVTDPFDKSFKGKKVGLLVCACGGNDARMKEIAEKYGMKVVAVEHCKQAQDPKGNGAYKCENPGNCPGQAVKCMNIKKAGATEILISNCSDCTNTVMASAPGLGLNVHHETDHVFKTMGVEVMRHLTKSKFVEGDIPAGCTASRNPEEKKAGGASSSGAAPFNLVGDDGDFLINIQSGSDISITWED